MVWRGIVTKEAGRGCPGGIWAEMNSEAMAAGLGPRVGFRRWYREGIYGTLRVIGREG